MAAPQHPITLSPEQVAEITRKLAHMRHEVNNQLALVVAALELMQYKPEVRERMISTISEQPKKIMSEIARFSAEFEGTLGIEREEKRNDPNRPLP